MLNISINGFTVILILSQNDSRESHGVFPYDATIHDRDEIAWLITLILCMITGIGGENKVRALWWKSCRGGFIFETIRQS